MNIYSLPVIVTTATSLILGIFVYAKGKDLRPNRIWAALSFVIALWSFAIVMIMNAPNDRVAYWAARLIYFGAIPIPAVFLHFITVYVQSIQKRRPMVILAYLITAMFLALNCTDLLVVGIKSQKVFKYFGTPGKAYIVFLVTWFLLLLQCFLEMIRAYKQSVMIQRNQIKYLIFASIIGFAGGATAFLPALNLDYAPYGHYFVGLYTFIIAYAIVKHRMMDISFVIKKSAIYAFASLLLLIPLSIIIVVFQKFFFKDSTWLFLIAVFCIMFIAAYFFQLMKVRAERTIESYIFKNKYDYKKTISDLSRAMVSILDIHELCREIITTTTQAMRVNQASIFIFDEEAGGYRLYDSIGLGDTDDIKRYPKDNPLFKWVGERNEIVIREELERYDSASTTLDVTETLKTMGSELCLPLVTKQKLIGIINLGMKGKGEMYTHEDLELLDTMANQATVAIENARLYEDLIRAKVQMQRADRLAALGTLTAGLAHEIRNPLVAIKTFTQLLPTRFDDTEFRDHFLKVTAGEVDRIASLVTELLDFARPSQPKLNSEDLNQVVEKMALLVDTESHKKNIKILKDLYASLPFVTLDKEQIKQVLLNILLNAVDATPENGTISVSTRPLTRNGYLDYVQVTIADTGKGIPEEDLEKVFTPFYTTKHTGSGLGLSISHQIVQEHQGNIEVESTLNAGTTFRINLPVNPSLMEKGTQRRSSDEKNVSH